MNFPGNNCSRPSPDSPSRLSSRRRRGDESLFSSASAIRSCWEISQRLLTSSPTRSPGRADLRAASAHPSDFRGRAQRVPAFPDPFPRFRHLSPDLRDSFPALRDPMPAFRDSFPAGSFSAPKARPSRFFSVFGGIAVRQGTISVRQPGGLPELSRGLSTATPPVSAVKPSTLKGCQKLRSHRSALASLRDADARMRATGGVVACSLLNPRLISAIPPGWLRPAGALFPSTENSGEPKMAVRGCSPLAPQREREKLFRQCQRSVGFHRCPV